MPKRVAVVDIGSNSARVVIFQRTSRYGFHLIAQKKAQANVITRREETASTRSLLNTAKLMEDNTMLFKLKEMEYVEKIADKIGEISVSGSGNIVEQLKTIFTK